MNKYKAPIAEEVQLEIVNILLTSDEDSSDCTNELAFNCPVFGKSSTINGTTGNVGGNTPV